MLSNFVQQVWKMHHCDTKVIGFGRTEPFVLGAGGKIVSVDEAFANKEIPVSFFGVGHTKLHDITVSNKLDFYFLDTGYLGNVKTKIYKRITKNNLKDANPNKLFNYILQASETEYSMQSLMDINRYLADKLTKPVLYTYDSILFDVNKAEGKNILVEIVKLMQNQGFPTKCYFGTNYHDMNSLSI